MIEEKNNKKTSSGLMARAEAINKALENEKNIQEEKEADTSSKGKKQKIRRPRKDRGERKYSVINRLLTKIIIILILLCSLVGGGLFYLNIITKPAQVEAKSIVIQDQLLYCQEFVSIKYKYSDVVSLKKSARIGPSKSFSIIKYSGIVRVGIRDITMCDYEVSDDGKSVKITLPDAEVLGNEISSQEVFDEQQSIFVPIKLEEVFKEIEKSKEEALEEILQTGILNEAKEYSRRLVRQFLLSAGYENVEVK